MAIVAVAIVLSFHLKSRPSPAELRMAKPLGLVFWGLSVACLLVGLGNYIRAFSLSFLLTHPRPFFPLLTASCLSHYHEVGSELEWTVNADMLV